MVILEFMQWIKMKAHRLTVLLKRAALWVLSIRNRLIPDDYEPANAIVWIKTQVQRFAVYYRRILNRFKSIIAICKNGIDRIRLVFKNSKKHFIYKPMVTFYKTVILFVRPMIKTIQDYLKPIFLRIQHHFTAITRQYWEKLRKFKVQDQTIGEIVDAGIIKINQYAWVKQLRDASQYDTRLPTLISTFFANLLALVFPLSLMQVYDRIIPNRTFGTLIFLSIGVLIAFMIEAALRIIRSYINLWADTKYEFLLGKTAFTKLVNAPMYVSENTDVGTRLKQFAILDEMKGFYNTQLLSAFYDIPFLLLFLFTIAYLAGWLFVVPLIVTVITAYIVWRFAQYWEHLLENKITFEAKESDFIINVLTGIHTAKSIGMEELLIRRHERLQESGMKINFLSGEHDGDLITIKTVSSQLALILTATIGSIMVIHGHLTIGGLAACILLTSRVMRPFDHILTAFNRLNMLSIVRKKLDVIFQLPSEKNLSAHELDITQGEISLKYISFHFGDYTEHDILKNLNLTIPPNTLVGITGSNQSEKTTLLNILATIAQPTAGQYLIDQKEVDQYQTYALRKKIVYLNRSGKLFRGTIMDNLSAFDEKLIPAARRLVDRLGLNSILSRLPSGYDTFVGEKAVEALPGGVMNLIFIVRALVNQPKIILFDETNINLDTQSNQKMLDLLTYLKESATVIVLVSHESTIALMDMVYAFQEGKLMRVQHGK